MKLLTALRRLPADNCVILTYNTDLPFFEYIIFEPLYASGCRNTLVLCDPSQYELALKDAPVLRHAGQRYLLLPARTSPSGAFHPKLILLTSDKGGRLFVTSSNLTRAGYTRNWEVVSLFEYNARKPDPVPWLACRWAFDTISRIVDASDADKITFQRLERLLGTTSWLRQESPLTTSAPVWLLHNLDEPLLDRVLARYQEDDGSPISEIVVISPFFDTGAHAVDRLLAQCHPQRLHLYTQGAENSLNPQALKAALGHHNLDFRLYQLDIEGRWLHAKTLLLRTERGAWLATGSANLSASAWLHRAATGNTEIVSLRFEHEPTYFNSWLDELITHARPLELNWEEVPSETKPKLTEIAAPLTLLSATLSEDRLALRLIEPLPADAFLTVHLAGNESRKVIYKKWRQEADCTLILRLAPQYLPQLESPTLVTLEATLSSDRLWANTVLLHNLGALRRFSRPVRRRDRPRVPEGIVPESYEHCAKLLEMLHDLLAMNSAQLLRHRGRIASLTKIDRQERQMVVEEEGEYDPDEHFVEEQIRVAASGTGADLYADFYDRLTYEELLHAALAAVYHPMSTVTGEREPGVHPPTDRPPQPSPPPDDETLRAKMLNRIKRNFKRLVRNFANGVADADYLAEVPPQYLLELFVIVSVYLRVVWRDGMLNEESFVEFSLILLSILWGLGQPGAWKSLRSRLTNAELDQEKARLTLVAQAWLHAYVVSEVLTQTDDRRIYDLAAWMRRFDTDLGGPDALEELHDYTYQRLWRASFPSATEIQPVAEVASHLREVGQRCDETSLLAEIGAWPSARASTSLGTIAYMRDVPILEVTLPLSDASLDRCLRAFVLFVIQPQPKQVAWSRFTNANPPADSDDLECVTMFYRSDRRLLAFAVRRASGEYRPDLDATGLTPEELGKIKSLAELGAFRSA